MSDDELGRADGRAIRAVNIRKRSDQFDTAGDKRVNMDDKLKKDHFMKADSDQIDLDALLQAVIDISDRLHHQEDKVAKSKTKPRPRSAYSSTSVKKYGDNDDARSIVSDLSTKSRRKGPLSSRPGSVIGGVQARPRPHEQRNLSFDNAKVEEIDRENQRLLKKILRSKAKTSGQTKSSGPVRVKSSSEVNRSKLQQQIDNENLAMLRRLEAVKPTKTLSKDYLLREHFKQSEYSNNVSRSGSRQSLASSGNLRMRSSSLSNLTDMDSRSEISSRSRRSSASSRNSKTRCSSARSSLRGSRTDIAIWEPGW